MEHSYVDLALTRYEIVHGGHVPQPSRGASYEVHHGGRHYIVLARDARHILGVYQVYRGALRVMARCPRPIVAGHRERVLRHAHAASA